MNGPDHFREAERLLIDAERHNTEHPGDMRIAEITASCAQVHATLALAAATAMQAPVDGLEPGMSAEEWKAWSRVAAVDSEGSERR